jgi:hypothetical protein
MPPPFRYAQNITGPETITTIVLARAGFPRCIISISLAIVRRLNPKPMIRVESRQFVGYLQDQQYLLGPTAAGLETAAQDGADVRRGTPGAVQRKGLRMSWSLEEPEWPPVCECQYDEARDVMGRGNCQLRCGMEEEISLQEECPVIEPQVELKKPVSIAKRQEENAA